MKRFCKLNLEIKSISRKTDRQRPREIDKD